MSQLFTPYRIRETVLRNRVVVSPMCQYSSVEGMPSEWHLAHLGSFARGGAGLVFTEAAAVVPEGRISPSDAGIWNDEQGAAWGRIVDFVHSQGAAAGIQLAHAGRKASTTVPWQGRGVVPASEGGWEPVAPSPVAYPGMATPRELTVAEIQEIPGHFAAATARALAAGFDALEIHGAHGYLLHEFYSPLSNLRTDEYGGGFDHRVRLLLEVVAAVRAAAPRTALSVRISASDWVESGWTVEDSVRLAGLLREAGADLVDASSGGNARAEIPLEPGYQVPFAERIRRESGVPTGAVGLITEAGQAEEIIASGSADLVFLARALLRNPHWVLQAAHELGVEPGEGVDWPLQYARAAL